MYSESSETAAFLNRLEKTIIGNESSIGNYSLPDWMFDFLGLDWEKILGKKIPQRGLQN